ncbi:MAG: FtsW/RodA/SpoVE family cell cycle protein, partial [Bacteroidota bacterium]
MPSALSLNAPRRSDRVVLTAVLLLAATGVVAVYSASSFFKGDDTDRFLLGHVARLGLAVVAMGAFSLVDYRWLARLSRGLMVVALGLLVFVQFRGVVAGGAQRWIDLGLFTFQPSDVAKVAILLHTAVLLAKKQPYIENLARGYLPLLVWIAPTILLIGMEDLSTAAILLATLTAMMFVARVKVSHLLGTLAIGLVLAIAFLTANPQRSARIDSWLGTHFFTTEQTAEAVHSDQDENYQPNQAKIAFAMGGVTGRGPGKSVQRNFLPAPYNDFIFAIVAEEYG